MFFGEIWIFNKKNGSVDTNNTEISINGSVDTNNTEIAKISNKNQWCYHGKVLT